MVINCPALPKTLLERELFGHEKGAFTGAASAQPRLFEGADGGTMLIDELATSRRADVIEVLRRAAGNKAGAARTLGISRRSLYRLIDRFVIADSEFESE